MGFLKNQEIEAQDRGFYWIGDDKYVCAHCVEDDDLKSFIVDREGEDACSYCGRPASEARAIPVDELLGEIAEAILHYYEPFDGSYYDSERGEPFVSTFDTETLFRYEIDWPFKNDELDNEIVGAFAVDLWTERDPLGLRPEEALAAGWNAFSHQVRHVTRYLFFSTEDDPFEDAVPPREILARIHRLVDEQELVNELGAATKLFRARHRADLQPLTTVEDLGAPSADQARTSTRMSAAGIPVFYGALDQDTAVKETLAHAGTGSGPARVRVSWGTFVPSRPLRVLDLRTLRPIPGFFDSGQRDVRPSLQFLWRFRQEVARPIPADGEEHIEYVPTQVVAEYFRHVYLTPEGERIDGILYPSSVHPDGVSCVLFFSGRNCCLLEPGWKSKAENQLALDDTSVDSKLYRARWEPSDVKGAS